MIELRGALFVAAVLTNDRQRLTVINIHPRKAQPVEIAASHP